MREIILNDENLNDEKDCEHNFLVQGNVKVEGIIENCVAYSTFCTQFSNG